MFSVVRAGLNRNRPSIFFMSPSIARLFIDRTHVSVRRDDDPELSLALDGSLFDQCLKLRQSALVVFNPLTGFIQNEQQPLLLLGFPLTLFDVEENRVHEKGDVVQFTAFGFFE